ncbi:hypothetical protein [Dokdonella fugitiva]|uniref:Uncharacterized protein n=1 Tax=Dokdonella fugitiva TaxID=328517 RepID=A0A4R2HR59_9GAMM|nr:hypothetical protein [Dokdonella fugitiva]TCO32958.1 hypothetical protein EV148_1271 [Dokdonella fugitiva]
MSVEAAKDLAEKLELLAQRLDSHKNNSKFSDHWQWQVPPLTTDDLSFTARKIAEKIESVDWSKSNDDATSVLEDLAPKVDFSINNNASNIFAGPAACEAVCALLHNVDLQINSILDPSQVKHSLAIPASILRSVNAATQRLDQVTAGIDGIDSKITSINRAYDAAEKLPLTMEELDTTLREIEQAKQNAGKYEIAAKKSSDDSEEALKSLNDLNVKAQAVLSKVNSAYRAATSEGLAHEFMTRSEGLRKSMLIWVLVLIGALLASGLIAQERIPVVLASISDQTNWSVLLLKLALGAATVAAPVWLAWVATKQIGQRFRLSEDYAYKAALSAAYEGYKAEATNLDPLFEARLFSIALGRLDEIPLRLIEKDVHGSPLHELLNSIEFRDAAQAIPSLKERALQILRERAHRPATPIPSQSTDGSGNSA